MKQKLRVAVVLLLLFSFLLSACASTGDIGTVTSDLKSTGEKTTGSGLIDPEPEPLDIGQFTIVRGMRASSAAISSATYLKNALSAYAAVAIEDDFYQGDLVYYGREILIGKTNRPESTAVFEELGTVYRYIIRQVGDHIVIAAQDEDIQLAVEAFLATYLANGKIKPGADLKILKEYPIQSLTINGVDIQEFSIVIPKNFTASQKKDVEWMAETICSAYGATLPLLIAGEEQQGSHCIYIGTAGGDRFSGFGEVDYIKKTENGNLYLGGNTYWADIKAIYSFVRSDIGCSLDGTYTKKQVSLDQLDLIDRYKKPEIVYAATCNMGDLFDGSERMIAEAVDAGFSRITVNYQSISSGIGVSELLKYATVYGVQVLFFQEGVTGAVYDYSTLPPGFITCLDCPMTVGHYIWDEPGANTFGKVAQAVSNYKKAGGKQAFTNLLPMYASSAQLNTSTYREYVSRFVNEVNPEELWVDIYPFYYSSTYEGYMENVSIVSKAARENGLDFGIYIQSAPYNMHRSPTYADLSCQLYTSLCFGAKNIEYFIYTTMPQPIEDFGTALIGKDYSKTALYYYAQILNEQTSFFADTYGKYHNLGAFSVNCSGTWADFTDQYHDFTAISDLRTSDHCVIGCFEGENNAKAFSIVNVNSLETTNPVVLSSFSIQTNASVRLYQNGQESILRPDADGFVTISLRVGDGAFAEIL